MIIVDKNYEELARRLPLVEIRNREHLIESTSLIRELMLKGDSKTKGETEYLRVLSKLIAEYEAQEFSHLHRQMNHGEILESLLETSGLNQLQLAEIIDMQQARISDVINGKRELSKSQVIALVDYFKLSTDLFFSRKNAELKITKLSSNVQAKVKKAVALHKVRNTK